MPYKINWPKVNRLDSYDYQQLTDLQRNAIHYLTTTGDRWVDAREVAPHYGYPNGQYFRGVLASLHYKELLLKKET